MVGAGRFGGMERESRWVDRLEVQSVIKIDWRDAWRHLF